MSQKHKSTKRPNPITRLQNFLRRNGESLDQKTRSDLVTNLEQFVADPETDRQTGLGTSGRLTRTSLWEVGIGEKWIGFPKTQAEDFLAALKSEGTDKTTRIMR